jgi:hypothetical protein
VSFRARRPNAKEWASAAGVGGLYLLAFVFLCFPSLWLQKSADFASSFFVLRFFPPALALNRQI